MILYDRRNILADKGSPSDNADGALDLSPIDISRFALHSGFFVGGFFMSALSAITFLFIKTLIDYSSYLFPSTPSHKEFLHV